MPLSSLCLPGVSLSDAAFPAQKPPLFRQVLLGDKMEELIVKVLKGTFMSLSRVIVSGLLWDTRKFLKQVLFTGLLGGSMG